MKRLIVILLTFMTIAAIPLIAQEETEEVQTQTKEIAPENTLRLRGGFGYRVMSLPYYKLGTGMDFKITRVTTMSVGIDFLSKPVPASTEYSDGTAVGGSVSFVDLSLMSKFSFGSLWVGPGFTYQVMTGGSYYDESENYYTINNADEPSRLLFDIGFGFQQNIGPGSFIIPGISLSYALPSSAEFEFLPSDINIGINFDIGLKM